MVLSCFGKPNHKHDDHDDDQSRYSEEKQPRPKRAPNESSPRIRGSNTRPREPPREPPAQKKADGGAKEEEKARPTQKMSEKPKRKKTVRVEGGPKVDSNKVKDFSMLDDITRAPDYWKCNPKAQYKFYAIKHKSPVFEAFREVLSTDKPKQLNKGRDVREVGEYTYLDLVGVWRMEKARIWANYAAERARMRHSLESRGVRAPNFFGRKNLYTAIQKLPGFNDFWCDINETYLIHGTVAEWILPIAKNGISPPLTSAALFGKGSYYAEDSAKNDQYVKGDFDINEYPELHKKIFPPGGEHPFPQPPYKAYYLILCRILIGYPVCVKCTECETREMFNVRDEGCPIFATAEERELANIPNISGPPMPYHSLIAEKGFAVVRFREFCIFHANRVYPEYLMCYSRK
eukprot:GEMP01028618.1.p1 GENE.GEMP01028618.1~~GEMP01028618.1.p1  ORF type:complete len:404 (+),score=88.73 GEMP01028618.1:332-1543(+)